MKIIRLGMTESGLLMLVYASKSFNFSKEMNMDEFKVKLKEYAENNPYPNMDD